MTASMRYEVQFRRQYSPATPELTEFNDAREALEFAISCIETSDGVRLPYYMIRIHDRQTSESLTIPALQFQLEGRLVLR